MKSGNFDINIMEEMGGNGMKAKHVSVPLKFCCYYLKLAHYNYTIFYVSLTVTTKPKTYNSCTK